MASQTMAWALVATSRAAWMLVAAVVQLVKGLMCVPLVATKMSPGEGTGTEAGLVGLES